MFDWFYEFLYSISKTIFRLIDGLMMCANKLCGTEDVTLDGENTDFLTYLFRSEQISFAFKIASLIGIIVLVFFTIFAIIRSVTKEKAEGTPGQICFKALKSFLMFLFVPAIMLATIWVGNTIMMAMYKATSNGSASIGSFLFGAFAQDGGMPSNIVDQFINGVLDYTNTAQVSQYMDLANYSFFFSWLAGGVVLFTLASSLFLFVDRIISIIILYVVSPFSISTQVLDDGAHFKLWRDQILVKFFTGYGSIIALNIYMLIVQLTLNPSLVFFPGSEFGNLVMKLLLIGGGALTLKKSMALIGNLIASGAGSTELRDNAITAGGLAGMAKGIAGSVLGGLSTVTGLRAAKSIVGDALNAKSRDLGEKLLKKMGVGVGDNRIKENNEDSDSGSKNTSKPSYGGGNLVENAISGGGNNNNSDNSQQSDNTNSSQPQDNKVGDKMVDSAIMNGNSFDNKKEEDE